MQHLTRQDPGATPTDLVDRTVDARSPVLADALRSGPVTVDDRLERTVAALVAGFATLPR